MTQGAPIVLDEALVGKWPLAELTVETVWVPAVVEGLDDAANDKLATFATTGRE